VTPAFNHPQHSQPDAAQSPGISSLEQDLSQESVLFEPIQ
jgi:hypothetical protein